MKILVLILVSKPCHRARLGFHRTYLVAKWEQDERECGSGSQVGIVILHLGKAGSLGGCVGQEDTCVKWI